MDDKQLCRATGGEGQGVVWQVGKKALRRWAGNHRCAVTLEREVLVQTHFIHTPFTNVGSSTISDSFL